MKENRIVGQFAAEFVSKK